MGTNRRPGEQIRSQLMCALIHHFGSTTVRGDASLINKHKLTRPQSELSIGIKYEAFVGKSVSIHVSPPKLPKLLHLRTYVQYMCVCLCDGTEGRRDGEVSMGRQAEPGWRLSRTGA